MASSSSSSSASEGKKKKKDKKDKKEKDKAAKKAKKKEKKEKKKDKKSDKKRQRAEEWECNRPEAVRLIVDLLKMDPGVFVELGECIFDKLDSGEPIKIAMLESAHLKKKLRHLLEALRIKPGADKDYISPDSKVSFRTVFDLCVKEAQSQMAAVEAAMAAKEAKMQKAIDALAAQSQPKGDETAARPQRTAAELAPARGPPEGAAGEAGGPSEASEPLAGADDGQTSEAAAAAPKAKKKKGPQLPSPGIFAADEEAEENSDDDNAGPKVEGEEREGMDLRALPARSTAREEWMVNPSDSMAGLFGGPAPKKTDTYQVKRSQEEQKKFEELMAARGPSLVSQVQGGDFGDATANASDFRKRQKENEISWGGSSQSIEKRQRGPGGGHADGGGDDAFDHGHEAFNPDKDLNVSRPMNGADFSKLLTESSSKLAGRFTRGGVTSSFL